jgi:ketopantoate reductase
MGSDMSESESSSFAGYLESAFPRPSVEPGKAGLRPMALSSEQDSQLAIIQITQYAMYVVFQLLVLALTAAVTASLIVTIWRITAHPDTSQLVLSVVAALGAIVAGAAAIFIQKQATNARQRWMEVRHHRGDATA